MVELHREKERSIIKRNQIFFFSFPQYTSPISEEALMDNEEGNRDENESDNENIEEAPL
jgi:hypothetical protein